MLRFVVGDDNFRRAMGEYAKRSPRSLVETRDLERAFSDVTGRGLEWFWQEWAYLQGAPTFEVSSAYDAERRLETVTVLQTQRWERSCRSSRCRSTYCLVSPTGAPR